MPCILIVLAAHKPKGAKDAAYWQRGHVVDVKPAGAILGRRESISVWRKEGHKAADFPGEYATIEVDDMTEAEAKSLFTEQEKLDTGLDDPLTGQRAVILTRRRKHRIDLPDTGFQFRMNRNAVLGRRATEAMPDKAEKDRIKAAVKDKFIKLEAEGKRRGFEIVSPVPKVKLL